jgi:tetratricopeptide (TPR) repeat protein
MHRDPEGLLELVRVVAPALVPRSVGWGLVALVAAGFLWTSPLSPVPLLRADVLLGQGRALSAARTYDAVAAANPLPAVRARALERAASTWAVELMVPREARLRLEQLVWYRPGRADTAAVLADIGRLLLEEGDPAAAAVRLREAHDLAPMAPEAGERLAAAAAAADTAGDRRLADALWRRLGRTHPEHAARAELGRATVALHEGDVPRALAAYQRVAAGTFDPDLAATAALGETVCRGRLGDVQGALEVLDDSSLPPSVTRPTAEGLEARAGLAEPTEAPTP